VIRKPVPLAALFVAAIVLNAQEPQKPAGNPPAEPPPGAANGPQPGPAAKPQEAGQSPTQEGAAPGAQKTGAQKESKPKGEFLAVGPAPDPQAVERGQKLFVTSCAFCHGSNAKGGATGPDLVRSVLVLHDEGMGKDIGPVILNGRPAKGMPKFDFSEDQIKDIAAFLRSRNQAAANRMDYKILNINTGDAKAGEAYFTAHCANCHSATGDLAHIASKYDAPALQNKFLYPAEHRREDIEGQPPDVKAEKTVTVGLPSGETVSGTLDHIDDFSVAVTDSSGEYHSFPIGGANGVRIEIRDPLKAHEELLKQYTDADMHNVLAYLETLK
jgi:cytochrome c oxidase cbb3-type subunit III